MKYRIFLPLFFATLLCGAMDLPTPPACAEGVVASYARQYDKVFEKRKAAFMALLQSRVSDLQAKGDYTAAKELAHYAALVESGAELKDGASYGVEPPEFFKRTQWVDGKGARYVFVSGRLEGGDGRTYRLTYASRDFVFFGFLGGYHDTSYRRKSVQKRRPC